VDTVPDWESKLARKFGGYQDGEEYVRLCVEQSRRRCTLSAASIANMCLDPWRLIAPQLILASPLKVADAVPMRLAKGEL